jgi:ABC-type branched-subunit amino acid transport system ATPase component
MKLDFESLSVSYDGARVVEGITLSIGAGDLAVVIGRNGVGKSSILKGCLGFCDAHGVVRLDGREVNGPPDRRVREFGLALLPQDRRVFGGMTGRQNLVLSAAQQPVSFRRELEGWLSGQPSASSPWASLNDLLGLVRSKLDLRAANLSGGEQSVIGLIGTVLACRSVLLLDEITAGIAPTAVPAIRAALVSLAASGQYGMILAEQDHAFALNVATRLLWVENRTGAEVAAIFEVPHDLLTAAKSLAPPPDDLISWLSETPWGSRVVVQ